jgi:hypothetical protein
MESTELINCKNEFKILNKDIIESILESFNNSNIKQKKISSKKKNNIFKNTKFRLDKNKIKNKIILILNKVSENNLNNLLIEFICNITLENEEDFIILQKEFFIKLIKDIKFINNILKFVSYCFKIIYYKNKYLPEYFYYLIETKLCYEYKNEELDESDDFLEEFNTEIYREGFLKLLFNLNKNSFFTENITEKINILLLDQNYKLPDIYFWYSLNKNEISELEKNKLNEKIKSIKSINRDKILLTSILESISENNDITVEECNNQDNDNKDSFIIEIENIIEEYIYLKDNEEIIEFLKSNCDTFDKKNIFCMYLLKSFFYNNEINWLKLFSLLVSKKYLYKSNLSKGIILFTNGTTSKHTTKMKELLIFLKQQNITKNIEYIFKKYKIKINY